MHVSRFMWCFRDLMAWKKKTIDQDSHNKQYCARAIMPRGTDYPPELVMGAIQLQPKHNFYQAILIMNKIEYILYIKTSADDERMLLYERYERILRRIT